MDQIFPFDVLDEDFTVSSLTAVPWWDDYEQSYEQQYRWDISGKGSMIIDRSWIVYDTLRRPVFFSCLV